EDRSGDVAAERARALDRDGDRDLRFVCRREAYEPGLIEVAAAAGFVARHFRGAGLAGNRDAGYRRVDAGPFVDDAFHRRRQLSRRLFRYRLAGLGWVESPDDAAVGVDHPAPDLGLHLVALVGDGGGDQRVLERRHQQPLLADRDPGDVDRVV